FYTVAGIGPGRARAIRGLPVDVAMPRYFEPGYFLFVVVAFATIGTAYLLSGIYLYGLAKHWLRDGRFWSIMSGIGVGSCVIHVLVYKGICIYREHKYLL